MNNDDDVANSKLDILHNGMNHAVVESCNVRIMEEMKDNKESNQSQSDHISPSSVNLYQFAHDLS